MVYTNQIEVLQIKFSVKTRNHKIYIGITNGSSQQLHTKIRVTINSLTLFSPNSLIFNAYILKTIHMPSLLICIFQGNCSTNEIQEDEDDEEEEERSKASCSAQLSTS